MSRLKVAEILGITWKLRWDSTSCQFSIDVNIVNAIVFVCVICTPSSQQLVPTSSAKSSGKGFRLPAKNLSAICVLCFFDVFDSLLISNGMPLDLFVSKGALKNHKLIDFCTTLPGV